MKIGIVGANSQVGTELCFLLDVDGIDVVPIVRNELGAAMFGYHDFAYRIGDVAHDGDAGRVLKGLDVVVIAAFASYVSRGELQPKRARNANENLVRNSVIQSGDEAILIYFSSLAAFGSEVRHTDWWWYTREKRHLEREFFGSEASTKRKYAFRLGHVFGQAQGVTNELISDLRGKQEIHAEVDPDRESNIVHTTTIIDAIRTVIRTLPTSGTYSIVNQPNWTWSQVLEFYTPEDTEIVYHGGVRKSSKVLNVGRYFVGLLVDLLRAAPLQLSTLLSATVYLPEKLYSRSWKISKTGNIRAELNELRESNMVYHGMFEYDPVPGPFLDNLDRTETRLETESRLEFLKID